MWRLPAGSPNVPYVSSAFQLQSLWRWLDLVAYHWWNPQCSTHSVFKYHMGIFLLQSVGW